MHEKSGDQTHRKTHPQSLVHRHARLWQAPRGGRGKAISLIPFVEGVAQGSLVPVLGLFHFFFRTTFTFRAAFAVFVFVATFLFHALDLQPGEDELLPGKNDPKKSSSPFRPNRS